MPWITVDDESGGHQEWQEPTYNAGDENVFDPTGTGSSPGGLTPAEVAAGWTTDELGNKYVIKDRNLTFRADDGKDYSYSTLKGGFVDSKGNLAGENSLTGILGKFANAAKGLFTNKTTGEVDWGKLLTAGTGAYAASKSGNNTVPAGYQGSVPKLTAERQMLTAPIAGRRPGSGGIDYGGNVNYRNEAGALMPHMGGGVRSLLDLQTAAAANPYNNLSAQSKANLYNKLTNEGHSDADIRASANKQGNQSDSNWQYLQNLANAGSGAGSSGASGGDVFYPQNTAVIGPDILGPASTKTGIANMLSGIKPPATGGTTQTYTPSYGNTPEDFGESGVMSRARGGLTSKGFVVPADVVSHCGNGSTNAGLRLLAEKFHATPIHGKGDGMSDSIPTHIDGKQEARVADGEAFISPEMVARLGGGDTKKGAQKLYAMLDRIREARTGNAKQGKEINPDKYMPGGSVNGYSAGGVPSFAGTTGSVPPGATGMESSLSNWVGDYTTNMLGQGQALANSPYQAYTGPLTAGASDLQNKVFTGLQNTSFPGNLGQSFTNAGAPTAGANGQPMGGNGIASQYMNPYLQNVLQPQLAELSRQAQINNQTSMGGLTKAGAFGGGRQAIMESENNRNLLNAQNTAIGTGYSNAYDKGMQQFNTEQNQGQTLAGLMAGQGAAQRGIESEGIAADKAQFEEARLNPYKMVQFQQSLLSGLPLQSQTYNLPATDALTRFSQGVSTVDDLLKRLKVTQ